MHGGRSDHSNMAQASSKVPQVTLAFCISGFGYGGTALVFAGALVLVTLPYFFTSTSRMLLFWTAFVLTRPLGATVGHVLTKPRAHGGLALSRFSSSSFIALSIVACILLTGRKAGRHPG